MKVKALTAFNCGGPVKTGDEIDVKEEVGVSLVREGLCSAVEEPEAKEPETRKRPTSRSEPPSSSSAA